MFLIDLMKIILMMKKMNDSKRFQLFNDLIKILLRYLESSSEIPAFEALENRDKAFCVNISRFCFRVGVMKFCQKVKGEQIIVVDLIRKEMFLLLSFYNLKRLFVLDIKLV